MKLKKQNFARPHSKTGYYGPLLRDCSGFESRWGHQKKLNIYRFKQV